MPGSLRLCSREAHGENHRCLRLWSNGWLEIWRGKNPQKNLASFSTHELFSVFKIITIGLRSLENGSLKSSRRAGGGPPSSFYHTITELRSATHMYITDIVFFAIRATFQLIRSTTLRMSIRLLNKQYLNLSVLQLKTVVVNKTIVLFNKNPTLQNSPLLSHVHNQESCESAGIF